MSPTAREPNPSGRRRSDASELARIDAEDAHGVGRPPRGLRARELDSPDPPFDDGRHFVSYRRPEWFAELVRSGASPRVLADAVAEWAVDAPTADTLWEAELLANEVGRMPDGGSAVREAVTPEFLARLAGSTES